MTNGCTRSARAWFTAVAGISLGISTLGQGSSIFTVLQEQLGLKPESTIGPVDTVVVDHVEMPSEN